MVKTSGSFLCQHSSLESFAARNCMIAPVEHRQHEFLPVPDPVNPFRVPANLGWNGLGFPGLYERGLMTEGNSLTGQSMQHFHIPHRNPERGFGEKISLLPARVDGKPSREVRSSLQKGFLIFDQSGSETRLISSLLCPEVQNRTTSQTTSSVWNQQAAPTKLCGKYEMLVEGQRSKVEQAWTKPSILYEESGENEILDDGSEMHEDTEELNALLYSDDDDDSDDKCDDGDEASSGHSPLTMNGFCDEQEKQERKEDLYFGDEVASSVRSSKRQKAFDGGHCKLSLINPTRTAEQNLAYESIHDKDSVCVLEDGVGAVVGSKRPRKDKIFDTLRVLESIIPGVKSKDPLIILDEAISYLKCLKYNAVTMSADDTDTSCCYGSDH